MSDKQKAIELYQSGLRKDVVAKELGLPRAMVREWLKDTNKEDHKHYSVPLSEVSIPKLHNCTPQEFIDDLRAIALADPERVITRNYYRVHGKYSESAWSCFFGTWLEAKRQAGIILTRQQHHLEKHIAKHASVDHYRELSKTRKSYGDSYDKPNDKRFKQVIVISDLHDKNADLFYLDVVVDTCKRVQPDIIVIGGDLWDAPEFGRYAVDPRQWDVVGRIKFVHEHILKPIREACPNAQIDIIEGNHEHRLLKHFADATPALKAVLSDLHGFTVSKLFGLDEFEVNYIAKGDLSAYTLADTHKEVKKNYKNYWDCFIVHHDMSGSNLGMPGVSGHHHKTEVSPKYSEQYGAYNWVQIGCGHKLDAEYCHPKWQQSFVIATCDTESKRTVFDVATFAEDFAIVGGVYYERSKQ